MHRTEKVLFDVSKLQFKNTQNLNITLGRKTQSYDSIVLRGLENLVLIVFSIENLFQ